MDFGLGCGSGRNHFLLVTVPVRRKDLRKDFGLRCVSGRSHFLLATDVVGRMD